MPGIVYMAFILSLCPVGLNLAGLVLGLVSWVKIKGHPAERRGRFWIRLALDVAVFWVAIQVLIYVCLPLARRYFSREDEAKANLMAIYKAQRNYFSENHSYARNFTDLKWRVPGKNYYNYFLPEETIPNQVEDSSCTADPGSAASETGFTATASGNPDSVFFKSLKGLGSSRCDAWSINDQQELRRLSELEED